MVVPSWAKQLSKDPQLISAYVETFKDVAAHIRGMKADRKHVEQPLLTLLLQGVRCEEACEVLLKAPNFSNYMWDEFEEFYEPFVPKRLPKGVTLADYQYQAKQENMAFEITRTILTITMSRQSRRELEDPDVAILLPYIQVRCDENPWSLKVIQALNLSDKLVLTRDDPCFVNYKDPIVPFFSLRFYSLSQRDLLSRGLAPPDSP